MQMLSWFQDTFDGEQMRGIIDSFIKAQQEELDESEKPILTDKLVYGLIMDFVLGGEITVTFPATW